MRQDGAVRVRVNLVLLAAVAATGLLAAGCSGSSGDASPPPSSTKFVVNPLEPGHGILQLGKSLYPFDGVICAKGPVPSDPKDTVRIFGVYDAEPGATLYATPAPDKIYRFGEDGRVIK